MGSSKIVRHLNRDPFDLPTLERTVSVAPGPFGRAMKNYFRLRYWDHIADSMKPS